MAFTEEQNEAIKRKGANILVSAAAGSGKTTVLVERIINKILKDKVDIDKLLVVTFTDAAASEMRERILKALYNEIDKNPDDENLQKQLMLINRAHISTITSFCLDVVRNNFFEIGLSANFRIGDPTEIEMMKQEAIEKVFEDKYEAGDKDFEELIKLYTPYNDDQYLKDLVLKIYEFAQSTPYPEKWIDESIEEYNIKKNEDFAKTTWGQIIVDYAKKRVENYVENLESAKKSIENIASLEDCYETLGNDIVNLKSINFETWDKLSSSINAINWGEWSRKRKYEEYEKELKDRAKNVRDEAKGEIQKLQENINISSDEINSEIKEMYAVLKKLEKLIFDFKNEFAEEKAEKNIVDFSDIEHNALNILVDETGNKTEIAKKYQFEEVLIDEYQDSNLVQEKILNSISNGKNIFMVGDVKQSIYRFRQARPELFLDKYKKYKLIEKENEPQNCEFREDINTLEKNNYEEQENEKINQNVKLNNKDQKENNINEVDFRKLKEDTKIQLYKNFRSRAEVIDFTNVIFQNIMSSELGEIDYNEDEYLNQGASFEEPRIDCTPELYIIDTNRENDTEEIFSENEEDENKKIKLNETKISEDKIDANLKIKNKDIEQDLESKNNVKVEITEDEEQIDNIELEAKLLCKKIAELHNKGIAYKEMAVLLRSTANAAPVYEKELINQGIPVYSDTASEYLDTIEIDTIISLLKIIDNPLQDIPLVTVLRSKIGDFDDNELTKIRLAKRDGLFYYALEKEAKNYEKIVLTNHKETNNKDIFKNNKLVENEISEEKNADYEEISVTENESESESEHNDLKLSKKCYDFLQMLQEFRELEKRVPLDQLIWTIYAKTGYYSYVRLMPNGKLRQANLRKLFEKAKDYEKISLKGLFNFILFIEKVVGNNNLQEAKIISENDDVVRIMSIHKSKGLEFPVVFLCNVGRKFNEQDLKNKIVLDQDLGLGVNYVDEINEYPTVAKQAINMKIKKEMTSEEMRILYVALTRAKEKLIIIGSDKNARENYNKKEEELAKYQGLIRFENTTQNIDESNGYENSKILINDKKLEKLIDNECKKNSRKINPILVGKYRRYLDWIELVKKHTNLNLKVNFIQRNEITKSDDLSDEETQEKIMKLDSNFDKEKYEKIDELLNWKYGFDTDIPSKTSVTALKNSKLDLENGEVTILDDLESCSINNIEIENEISDDTEQDNEISKDEKGKSNDEYHFMNAYKNNNESEFPKNIIKNNTNNQNLKNIKIETLDEKLITNIKEKALTPAEKGTLVHLAMQKLNDKNIDKMIENLKVDEKSKNYLIENKKIFENYINSDLFKAIENAKLVQKETPFYMNVNYKNTGDKVLIQGVIDLYFIDENDNLILVDYKTDKNVDAEILKERYANQLNMYEIALEKTLKRKVYRKLIYSTTLNKIIEI